MILHPKKTALILEGLTDMREGRIPSLKADATILELMNFLKMLNDLTTAWRKWWQRLFHRH